MQVDCRSKVVNPGDERSSALQALSEQENRMGFNSLGNGEGARNDFQEIEILSGCTAACEASLGMPP